MSDDIPLDRAFLRPLQKPLWDTEYEMLNPGICRRPNPAWLCADSRGCVRAGIVDMIKRLRRDWIRRRRRWMQEKKNAK